MESTQLRQLADQQLNGTLEDAGFAQLEQALAVDAAARREYVHYMFLHGELACNEEILRALGERELQPARAQAAVPPQGSQLQGWTFALTAALLLALGLAPLVWRPYVPKSARPVATISSSRMLPRASGQPQLNNARLQPGTVRLAGGEARIRFASGADVFLAGPTVLGVTNRDESALFAGRMAARIYQPGLPFLVETPSVRVIDFGTEFGVSVNPQGQTDVHCFDGEIEIQSRVRLPRHYWNFDEEVPRDHANSNLAAEYTGSARRTKGLVGAGAAGFTNQGGSAVVCAARHHETFVVTTGITVEALIAPQWSGAGWTTRSPYDYDEIFRKEDGYNRVLLSFQNDHQVVPTVPLVTAGPCLSFGLNLAGHSYSELDMPLDGREGRPTLAQLKDGRPHHVVATYDSHTGKKGLYIDGQLAFSTRFPPGTLIVSGGTAPAVIGNLPAGIEPFHGVIDEVAYYDFALTADEVAQHYQHMVAGKNYFGLPPGDATSIVEGGWKATAKLVAGEAHRFDASTGRSLGAIPLDRARFAPPRRID